MKIYPSVMRVNKRYSSASLIIASTSLMVATVIKRQYLLFAAAPEHSGISFVFTANKNQQSEKLNVNITRIMAALWYTG